MLVLSLKVGQSVFIDNGNVKVEVSAIRGNRVKLAFTADPSIPIHRSIVQEEIEAERAALDSAAGGEGKAA